MRTKSSLEYCAYARYHPAGLKDPSQKNEALDQINQVCNAFAAHVSTHHIDLRMTNTSDQTLVQSAQYLQLPLAEQILWALINT